MQESFIKPDVRTHIVRSFSPSLMVSFIDSTIGGSLSPVSSNVQHYLAQATLPRLRLAACTPPMPSGHHKTHRNQLAIRPERYRRLRNIHRVKRDYLDTHCLEFIQKHIPSAPVQVEDMDPDAYEQPSIPCAGFDVEGFGPPPVRHIDGLRISWLEDNILRTVQAVLRMLPEYRDVVKDYSFTSNDLMRDEDQQIFRYFMWERSSGAVESSNTTDQPVKLILAYQPPWVLAPRDIELFSDKRLKKLPTYEACEGSAQQRYTTSHRLWAKLWDICKQNACSSFILTNYDQWVFGGFSKGWENGYTMGVKQAYPPRIKGMPKPDPKGKQPLSRTPTILEYLIYWTVSSMLLPDHFELPPVCDELPYFPRELPCYMYDIRTKCDVACAAYFQALPSYLHAVPDEIDLELAIDDPLEVSTPQAMTPTQSFFPASSVPALTFENIEPSESERSSQSSEVATSAGVRIGPESDSGNTPPSHMNDRWWSAPGPGLEQVAANENALNIHGWLAKNSAVPPNPVPSIPRAPSPVQSVWSDKSLATRQPRRCQGYCNISTVIVEDVYEFNFDGMDTT